MDKCRLDFRTEEVGGGNHGWERETTTVAPDVSSRSNLPEQRLSNFPVSRIFRLYAVNAILRFFIRSANFDQNNYDEITKRLRSI